MHKFVSAAFALVLLASPAMSGHPAPEAELVRLQATLQIHIERNLVAGALLQLDEKTGEIRQLYPAKAHPKIIVLGNYFYLCADFRDTDGKDVRINFYAAKDGDKYVIFQTTFEDNEELERLVESQPKLASN